MLQQIPTFSIAMYALLCAYILEVGDLELFPSVIFTRNTNYFFIYTQIQKYIGVTRRSPQCRSGLNVNYLVGFSDRTIIVKIDEQ